MLAALSVRLAVLRLLTTIKFAFFDEPTMNLDEGKRVNLADQIQKLHDLNQLFIISHDDTFQAASDHIIHFEKDQENRTKVKSGTMK